MAGKLLTLSPATPTGRLKPRAPTCNKVSGGRAVGARAR